MSLKLQPAGPIALILTIFFVACTVYGDMQSPKLLFPNLSITTSERSYTENEYPLYQLVDKNLKTTWVFNAYDYKGAEKKQIRPEDIYLSFECLGSKMIKTVKIINGYSKSEDLYKKNNRITRIFIQDDNDAVYSYDLEEILSLQEIVLPRPLRSFRIVASEIRQGSKYDDTCISEIMFLDESGEEILVDKEYFIYSSGGEYPYHTIFDRGLHTIYAPQSDGIVEIGFSPKGDKVYLINSEIDGIGFDIFDIRTGKLQDYLNAYVTDLEWITNSKVKVKYYDFNDDEGETIIDLSQ